MHNHSGNAGGERKSWGKGFLYGFLSHWGVIWLDAGCPCDSGSHLICGRIYLRPWSLGLARSLQVGRVTPSARDSTSDKERFLMRECVGSHLSEYLPDLAPGGQATFCPCQQALSIWPEPTSSHYCKLSVSSWVAVPPGLLWTVAASLQHKFYFAPDCELLPRTTLHPTYMLKVISFFKYKVYSTPNRGEDPKVQSLVQIQAWLQWIQQRLDIHRADNITCVSLSIRACVHLWLSTHLLGTKFISSNIMSGHSSPTFSTFLKDKKTKN